MVGVPLVEAPMTTERAELLAHLNACTIEAQSADPMVADAALEELYQHAKPAMRRGIGNIAVSGSDPDDLMQDAAIAMIRGIRGERYDGEDPRGNFFGWACTVAHNGAINTYRAAQRHLTISLEDQVPGWETRMGTKQISVNAETQALQAIMPPSERVAEVFIEAKIPSEFYEPYILFHVDGIPQKEIADILNVKLATVRTRIHRAEVKLHTYYGIGKGQTPESVTAGKAALRGILFP